MFHQSSVFCLGSWCALQGSNFKQNLPKLCPSCHRRWLCACFDPSISHLSAVEMCLPFAVLHNSSGNHMLCSGHPRHSSLSSSCFCPFSLSYPLAKTSLPFLCSGFLRPPASSPRVISAAGPGLDSWFLHQTPCVTSSYH